MARPKRFELLTPQIRSLGQSFEKTAVFCKPDTHRPTEDQGVMGYFANRPGATEASTSLAIAARDVVFAPSPSPDDGSISERVKKFLVTRQPLSSLCMATAPFVQPDGTTTIVYAIYGRHSKDGSNPKSTEDQVAECRADLLARGIEVPDDRVYMDPNIPGRYFNKREALQRMRVHAACIVAVGLVDLCLQHRPHVPRLDTDHR